MKEERRNAGWDGEDGGMSRQTASQVVVVVVIIVIILLLLLLLTCFYCGAPRLRLVWGAGVNGHKKVK